MRDIDLVKLKQLAGTAIDLGGIANYRKGAEAVSAFKESVTPEIMVALIEQLEAAQRERDMEVQYKREAWCEYHKLEAELKRRDAAAGDPVAGEARFKEENSSWSPCTAEHASYVLSHPEDWPNYEVRYLYAAAQPGVLPPEMAFTDDMQKYQWADRAMMLCRVEGYNQCRADAKALGCQPEKVVMLPKIWLIEDTRFGMEGHDEEYMSYLNPDEVKAALDAAGIRYETE